MVSLEDRINELCKGSMLMSPIWLARLVEEIFDASWIKRQASSTSVISENNQWPLLGACSIQNKLPHSTWSTVVRSKTESATIMRFLAPQGPLFMALRQSADAWVSVSFDSKLAQSDSVRIATGIATIMRQPKFASSDMPYRPQSRSFDSQSGSDQNCMITLPVPHYFILRLVAYLMIPDVLDALSKSGLDANGAFYQQMSSLNAQKCATFAIPSCIYSDLVDDYCEYLLSNARQPPGTTLITSRSLCADLARLYIQAVADFWLLPYASPMDSSSLSFSTNVSMPPPVLLQFIRRFLKRYFFNAAEEWCGPNTTAIRQTTFTALKQPLLAFLHTCATHWPLNTSFGNVVSCWRAVALPWHTMKTFSPTPNSTNLFVWDTFVSENVVFYSEQLLVPLILHLARANVACPAYASAVCRLSKVFGGASDTEALAKLLIRLSSTTSAHQSTWNNSSFVPTSPALMSGYSRGLQAQFNFTSPSVLSAVKQLVSAIDSTVSSPTSTCPGVTKELLRSAKNLLNEAFFSSGVYNESVALNESLLNKTPSYSATQDDRSRESGGRIPKFRRLPERQQSFTSFAKADDKLLFGEPDFRSSDIPILLKLQHFLANFMQTHDLLPKSGRVGSLCQSARFRWMADRRELAVMAIFLCLSYFMFSSPVFFFLAMIYLTIRTFLAAIVTHLEDLFLGQSQQQQSFPATDGSARNGTGTPARS